MAKRKSSKSNNTNNNNQEKKQKQVSEEEQLENDIKPELQILCEEEEKKATPSNAENKNDIKLQEVHVNIDKLEKTGGENKPPIKESEKSTESPELPNGPNEKSHEVENVLETNLEATDSQLCNINEDKLEQIPAKSYKENLGIDCADEKVKELVSTLSSMNRVIMDAKKDLASIRLKINHSTKSSKAI